MKQKKTPEGVEQVVEEFDVYRPIVMANIYGMEEVLGDRCITIVLEKSNKPEIIKLAEIWEQEKIFLETKKILGECSLCNVVALRKCYIEWNEYISSKYIYTYTTHTTNNKISYTQFFKRLNSLELDGRTLEIIMPLLLVSWEIGKKEFEELFKSIEKYILEKKEDQFAESRDIMFIDYISQETEREWIQVKDVTDHFKQFMNYNETDEKEDNWLNPKWVGRALKRLKLRRENRRVAGGVQVVLDIDKAQERIKMFK